jgi:predicted enzyme related to lactoylglutathione lyase
MVDTGTDRGIAGGFWPAPPEAHGFVQLHVEVDDVAASIEKAAALGATTLIPPQALPDGGKMAVIKDPDGIPLALFQPKA